jgi:hypothetical protein
MGLKQLAFADWITKKFVELNQYRIKNHTGLILTEEEYHLKQTENEFMRKETIKYFKRNRLLIDLNLPADSS